MIVNVKKGLKIPKR